MKKYFIQKAFLFVFLVSMMLINVFSQDISLSEMKYYVWDFSSADEKVDNTLLKNITEDFEAVLIETRQGKPLLRNYFSDLFLQKERENIDNEKPWSKLNDRLRDLNANVVVLGEVCKNEETNNLNILVKFKSLEGKVLFNSECKMDITSRFNVESRRKVLRNFVNNIFPSSGETSTKQNADEKNNYINNYYENDFLFVSVANISKTNNGEYIVLSLNVINTTNKDLYLAFNRSNGPQIATDNGLLKKEIELSGLPKQYQNKVNSRSDLSILYAGRRTNINIKFYGEFKYVKEVSFSSEMITYRKEKPETFSVGIANIKL